jgi:aminopeptidase S
VITKRRSAWLGISSRVAGAVLLAVALVGCGSAVPQSFWDNSLQGELVGGVSGAQATEHVAALQRIADENGGNRVSPSPGYDASVDYVVGVLRAAGYDVTTPTYPISTGRRGGGQATGRNVIAQTRTGDADRVVMVGAHLDSVKQGPGINDNGSGVATLLAIATKLGASPPIHNALRFAFWGSEEEDMQGSEHYVETLSSAERRGILLYLNVDMVASRNGGYFVQGGYGRGKSTSGPAGSAKVGQVLADRIATTGVTAEGMKFDGSSDYAPFVEAGIPSGGVLAGDEGQKTEDEASNWGGQAGQTFDSCYHSACDRIDNMDPVMFDRFTDAIAGAVGYFALSDQALVD